MTKDELLKHFRGEQHRCMDFAKEYAMQALIGKPDDFEINKNTCLDYYNRSKVWEQALTTAQGLEEQRPIKG